MRCGYGPDVIYSELARRSLDQWRALNDRLGRPEALWHQAGVLWMAAGRDPYTADTRSTLTRLGTPIDVLTPADVDRVLAALQKRQDRHKKFGQMARDMGLLEEEHILAALAVQMELLPGIQGMDLDEVLEGLLAVSATDE